MLHSKPGNTMCRLVLIQRSRCISRIINHTTVTLGATVCKALYIPGLFRGERRAAHCLRLLCNTLPQRVCIIKQYWWGKAIHSGKANHSQSVSFSLQSKCSQECDIVMKLKCVKMLKQWVLALSYPSAEPRSEATGIVLSLVPVQFFPCRSNFGTHF